MIAPRTPGVQRLAVRHGIAEFVYRDGGRSKVEEEGRCRLCLRDQRIRPLTRHHVVPKRWFRSRGLPNSLRDADANIVPLCRPCHDLIHHGQPAAAAA